MVVPNLNRYVPATIFCLAIAMFSLVIWRASIFETDYESRTELPVIKASPGVNRIRPDSPGGLRVPHQEKTVFDTLLESNIVSREERLRPFPEVPRVPDQNVPEAVNLDGIGHDVSDLVGTKVTLGDQDNVIPSYTYTERQEGVGRKISAKDDRVSGAKALLNTFHFVQLASMRTLDAAEVAWERIYDRVPGLLIGLTPTIVQANVVDGGGIFYRLQAGPLPHRDAAKALCKALDAKDLDCLIVQP